MKTQTFTKSNAFRALSLFGFFLIFTLISNPINAQDKRVVKGIVSDETGPLENATVILEGTNIYVDTNAKGAFTFPKLLSKDDTLIVSHIGFENQEVLVGTSTDPLKILMNDYAIVIVGSLLTEDDIKAFKNN